jgi:ABC-type bacteriocin/lantibiotic exporter with double-glycine peptidase domain
MSTGALVAFSMYTSQALAPLLSLVTLWDDVQLARGALERIEDVRKHPAEPGIGQKTPQCTNRLEGRIRFENVWFHYDGPHVVDVLRGVSLEIAPGECVALMGPSGSGKTTLARLLLGLYQPTQGRIWIDGCCLRNMDMQTYRQQIGVVLQENLLFSGTILENIALGDPEPNLQRAIEVSRMVAAHDFIMELAQGYSSAVGELGLTLSGGQRQRISLARALYRNPHIMILDEALSALDSPNAQAIRQNWDTIVAGKTVLIIAHNILSARMADRILALDQGVIASNERLSHAEWSRNELSPR